MTMESLLDDAYIDVCVKSGRPSGIAANAEALKSLPLQVRAVAVRDGIDLISRELTYADAVAESIRRWKEADR